MRPTWASMGPDRPANYARRPGQRVEGESPETGGATSSDTTAIAQISGDKPLSPLPEKHAVAGTQAAETAPREDPQHEVEAKDLFQGSLAQTPWQYQGYSSSSATWLTAAQRRHSHRRRANSLLGVGSVDLRGPHEPTPVPGAKVGQRPAQYFLTLTFALDHTVGHANTGTHTDTGEAEPDIASRGSRHEGPTGLRRPPRDQTRGRILC